MLRHFLFRFFDSDLVTAPGQTTTALIGAFSIFLPWFPLIVGPLRHKYAYFSSLAIPDPYRQAVRADELWLITLMMSAIGLLTAVKWQSLFPGLRDYYALGSLPLRAREIFAAKLLALLLVATAAVVTLNALPALMFPAVSSGRWAFHPALGPRVAAHTIAAVAACYFFCFGLVALQGVLLQPAAPPPIRTCDGHAPGNTGRDHAGAARPEFLHHAAGRQRGGPARNSRAGFRRSGSSGFTRRSREIRIPAMHALAQRAGGRSPSRWSWPWRLTPRAIAATANCSWKGQRAPAKTGDGTPPSSSGWCPIRASRR